MSISKGTRRRALAKVTPKARKATAGRTRAPETPLAIRTQGLEVGEDLRAWIHKHAGFKLGKFATHITRVTVRLEDLAGPKGKPSFACRIKTVVPSGASVIVESREPDARAAFDVAIDAHERAVRRMLERAGRSARPRG